MNFECSGITCFPKRIICCWCYSELKHSRSTDNSIDLLPVLSCIISWGWSDSYGSQCIARSEKIKWLTNMIRLGIRFSLWELAYDIVSTCGKYSITGSMSCKTLSFYEVRLASRSSQRLHQNDANDLYIGFVTTRFKDTGLRRLDAQLSLKGPSIAGNRFVHETAQATPHPHLKCQSFFSRATRQQQQLLSSLHCDITAVSAL